MGLRLKLCVEVLASWQNHHIFKGRDCGIFLSVVLALNSGAGN